MIFFFKDFVLSVFVSTFVPSTAFSEIKNAILMSTRKSSKRLELFHRYQHLVEHYANQVYSTSRVAYDQEDIKQELTMRLWTSLNAYAKKWKKYKDTGRCKPVPLEYYLRTVMGNRIRDFIKKVQRTPNSVPIAYQGQNRGMEFGFQSSSNIINFDDFQFEISGVDLLEGLGKHERACYILFLKGYTPSKLKRLFKRHFDAKTFIESHNNYLKQIVSPEIDTREYSFEVQD
jgi:DNA-directed RNA polymerase specialized sigma24 family protein